MLFIYLLLTANNEQQEWRGMVIERGQLITSRDHLSKATGISQQSIRTGLTRLKSTKEITIKSTSQYSVITICNYDKYQTSKYEINQQVNQLSNKPSTSDQPAINHKQEYKEVKNIKNNIYTHDFERFWKAYPNRHGRKVGKFATFKYYQKKLLNGDKESVIAAASNYANSKTAKDGYAKDPIRFLKDDFWRDWITEHIEPIANDPEVDDFLHSLKKKIKDGNYGNVRSD